MTQLLRVSIPGNAIYVSGTVNGVDATWTLVDEAWQAIVDRATDDIYHLSLTAISAAGTSATYNLTLYYGVLNLITDRTQADVDRVILLTEHWNSGSITEDEITQWTAGLKGAYNAEDLNRVGAAVAYLAQRFADYGYSTNVKPKQDWLVTDIPTPEQMERYLGDVQALKNVIFQSQSMPDLPESMDLLDYVGANNIEKVLLSLDTMIINMAAAWFYSGEIYGGET